MWRWFLGIQCCWKRTDNEWKLKSPKCWYFSHSQITTLLTLEGTSADCLSQSPLSKQGQLQPVAQDCVHLGFQFLQWCHFHNLHGHPAPFFNQHHRGEKNYILWLNGISCVSVCSHRETKLNAKHINSLKHCISN